MTFAQPTKHLLMKTLKPVLIALCAISATQLFSQQIVPFTNDSEIQEVKALKNDDTAEKAVIIYGITNAEALQFENLNAAGSLSAGVKLSKNVTGNVSFNFGTQAIKNEKADSVPLSLFYFPDVANTSFLAGIDIDLLRAEKSENKKGKQKVKSSLTDKHHHFSLCGEGSIQRRNIDRDSAVYQFGIFNFNSGLKYRWVHAANGHTAVLTFAGYYNHIRINKNNDQAFNTLFNDFNAPVEPEVKRYFHGISFLASLELDKVTVFARTFTDLNRSQDLAFTVGIRATADFISF